MPPAAKRRRRSAWRSVLSRPPLATPLFLFRRGLFRRPFFVYPFLVETAEGKKKQEEVEKES